MTNWRYYARLGLFVCAWAVLAVQWVNDRIVYALAGVALFLLTMLVLDYFGHCVALLSFVLPRRSHQPIPEAYAKKIMGKNFHGSDDALNTICVDFPRRDSIAVLRSLLHCPARRLKAARETCMLVAVLPISIYEMCHFVPRGIFHYTHGDDCDGRWYDTEQFARDKGHPDWYLLPLNLSDDGGALLPARVVVYAILVHFLITKEWLFAGRTIRCADECPGGGRVIVHVGNTGIHIGNTHTAHHMAEKNHLQLLGSAPARAQEARG